MRRATTIVLMGAVLVMGANSATAHPWSDWYSSRWRTGVFGGVDQDQTVDWRFVDNFCWATFRDSVQTGSTKWNAESTPMTFHFESAQSDTTVCRGTAAQLTTRPTGSASATSAAQDGPRMNRWP